MKKFLAALSVILISFLAISSSAIAKKGKGGNQIMAVEYYGQASSATLAADLVFTVTGLKNSSECVVAVADLGTGPAYAKKTVVTANTITVTMDAAQSAGTTKINYVCFEP